MKRPNTRSAFTLIELLVVVAIISLLISILLPSLTCARAAAKAAKCGVQLNGIGKGLHAYMAENNEWFPGVNTTGANMRIALGGSGRGVAGILRSRHDLPVQTWDWMSPILRYDTQLGGNRAERFQTLVNYYQCPDAAGVNSKPYSGSSPPDASDFRDLSFDSVSYLMPDSFSRWGGSTVTGRTDDYFGPGAAVVLNPSGFSVDTREYRSRLGDVGVPGEKIFAADGTRFLPDNDLLDFDHDWNPTYFGSFASSGGWWCGSTAYGVRSGSANWDGDAVSAGASNPDAQGRNLILSYRHGCVSGSLPTDCQSNKGAINSLFFDGHVARLTDRESREIKPWYPKGSIVRSSGASQGMTRVPAGSEVP
ncbi:MAG: prepilin-type N-terminal cleavage/methylation domain-containing protein [Phycisphaerales bacterium]|nr:prepilin-type N-terminal cleavage/methylation domain-containing protein [Phycisphaerales bacterium]